ncbi:FimB/Mfa2 family fimbrial subunit, partial [Bacteroides sp. 51]|uniref:FimB/Mfa2 family fimbrial subunit n=1 Tax=Bacteroides sp. 51 TaxID=2302938 RepID=UPI0013D8537C
TLTVRPYDHAGEPLSRKDVAEVVLYVFDSELCSLEKIDTHVGQTVTINAPRGKSLHIVGWGNLGGGRENCTSYEPGRHKDYYQVSLLPLTRAMAYSLSPDDLFRGEITLGDSSESNSNTTIELPIYRETGSLTITVRGLTAFAGFADHNYSIQVRETPSVIDFYGDLSGDKVAYQPTSSFTIGAAREEYYTPPFNMLPEEQGIHIDIYHGTELVTTISQDNTGQPIAIKKGQLTNVLIDLRSSLSVSMELTPWGEEKLWKEF